jgi:hypothetical protein
MSPITPPNTNTPNTPTITLTLNKEELQTIHMSLKFTIACLDSESMHLLSEMTAVLAKVEDKLN